MKASDFVNNYADKGLAAWEAKAFELITHGQVSTLSMREVFVESKDGQHRGSFLVSRDYLSLGEPEDSMRMPLTPEMAQKVVDFYETLLPTSKMVDAIWKSADVKLQPQPMVPNRFVNLRQFLEHSHNIDEQIKTLPPSASLIAGQKKDVIISKNMPSGKVVIYGWHRPDGSHIQPRSSIHSANYLDYSHGIRLIGSMMKVDDRMMRVEDVLRDPKLSSLLSNEGPITTPRYGKAPLSRMQGGLASVYLKGHEIVMGWGKDLFSRKRTV